MSDESPRENRSWLPEILFGLGGLAILAVVIGGLILVISLPGILPARSGPTPSPLAPTAALGQPTVGGPRGKIAFVSPSGQNADLLEMEPDGSHLTGLVSAVGFGINLAWSPDGSRLAYAWNGDIFVLRPDGSRPFNLTNSPGANDDQPQWSPDGSRILFTSDATGAPRLYLISPSGANLSPVTRGSGPRMDGPAVWSPDGARIVFQASNGLSTHLVLVRPDGSGWMALTGSTSAVDSPLDETYPAWSPGPGGGEDGQWIAYNSGSSAQGRLCLIHPDGSCRRCLGDLSLVLMFSRPAWSPDGARIAFGATNDRGNTDIYLVRADGSGLTRLTTDPGDDGYPAWSPDGTQIAFISNQNGVERVAVMNADGSGLVTFPTPVVMIVPPAWGK